uniref:SLED domain-containing protein n=1 Tax=Clastoptera arizonana TaxID=38151 RepID=A0A1B6CDI0_9HEMI
MSAIKNSNDKTSSLNQVATDEDHFDWCEYLSNTLSVEVPPTFFDHVEKSLLNDLKKGMNLEVPLTEDGNTFWIASIVMACGPLLSLHYLGEKDKSNNFWCDLTKVTARPLGWCEKNRKTLFPPAHLQNEINYESLISGVKNELCVPEEFLTGEGVTPVGRIKQGMKLEIQDKNDPYRMWVATIIQNIGGRLLLRYDTPSFNSQDFWLFYSSHRIFPFGWAQERGAPWVLRRPSDIDSVHGVEEWESVLKNSKIEAQKLPRPNVDFTKSKSNVRPHDLSVGLKLEAVHPGTMKHVCPASITRVFDSYFFLVEIDSLDRSEKNKFTWLASVDHPYIFPVGWAKKNNVKLSFPLGSVVENKEFDWDQYLARTKSNAAPLPPKTNIVKDSNIVPEMKLEAVNPEMRHQVCAATIKVITQDLLWIKLDSTEPDQDYFIYHMDSLDIFPVGWCQSNCYPLEAPKMCALQEMNKTRDCKESDIKENTKFVCGMCPKIYFNYKCFSGPYFNKGKLAQLPKFVGPGPVFLVFREIIKHLISVAYIPSRVLKELEVTGEPKPGNILETFKTRFKGNLYRASVEIVNTSDKVEEFCKDICHKLKVCPYMFGQTAVGDKCPEKCYNITKRKIIMSATTSKGNKHSILIGGKKPGRPKLESTNSQHSPLFIYPKRPLEEEHSNQDVNKSHDSNIDTKSTKKKRYETRKLKVGPLLRDDNFQTFQVKSTPSKVTSVSNLQIDSKDKIGKKKCGRKSKTETARLKKLEEMYNATQMDDSMYQPIKSNPLLWSIDDLYRYLKKHKRL